MLWKNYVFRRGDAVHDLWDTFFSNRTVKLLYICGGGFDLRAEFVLKQLLNNFQSSGHTVEDARLLLLELSGYKLDDDLRDLTDAMRTSLKALFKDLGSVETIPFGLDSQGDDDLRGTNALRSSTVRILDAIQDYTDIILDVSSLPRTTYLTLLTGILQKLAGTKESLQASGVNFQILVGEDAALDGVIQATDPGDDLVVIPGYSTALHAESVQDWPLVWFPILGEHRENQLRKILQSAVIPNSAEICPILPSPSADPRRADRLLVEYRESLFDSMQTPMTNIVYVHESNPFEAYRQLLAAMARYRNSMAILGGCRLVVTPLGSKLITLGAGLACFEMQPPDLARQYSVAIPHAEPTRYQVPANDVKNSKPAISSMLLTGAAYE